MIYDAHEDVPRQILAKHWIPNFLRKLISRTFERYENYVASKITYIITSTPTIEVRYKKININSEAICNYPILKENGELPAWETRKNQICYVGGITEIRGIREIIKVLEEAPETQLNLAGNFSPSSLRDEFVNLDVWNRVNEFGQVDRPGVIKILNESKLGMVTLHPRDNYLDSLPIKMFEYMYAGIPVIASNFPLWIKIINENNCGICVDPFDIKATKQAVEELLSNDKLAEEMGLNGRDAVLKQFNWEIEEKKLINIYRSIIK